MQKHKDLSDLDMQHLEGTYLKCHPYGGSKLYSLLLKFVHLKYLFPKNFVGTGNMNYRNKFLSHCAKIREAVLFYFGSTDNRVGRHGATVKIYRTFGSNSTIKTKNYKITTNKEDIFCLTIFFSV